MAVQQVPAVIAPPTADVVGNAFVHQYYLILHQSPESVHKFYQDVSKLGRPEENGAMGITSTMQAINEKILSLDYGDLSAEITTVDSQDSLNGGVLVLVTGYLTGRDGIRQKFTQSFFLAPQDKGYFVLNDIFRYVEEPKKQDAVDDSRNDVESPAGPKQDPSAVQESEFSDEVTTSMEDVSKGEKYNTSENGDGSDVEGQEQVIEVVDAYPNDSDVTEPNAKYEDVPKKSYASIVKVMREGAVNPPTPTPLLKYVTKVQEQQVTASPPPGQVTENKVSSSKVTENGNGQEADGHSIYLKGLPMNATYPQLENEFKRFGPIKSNGIQIRSQKGFCFGFVEFEEQSAAQGAIEASPITIGGRQVVIEAKKSTARGNGRDRFPSGRVGGAFRNEGARGRVNYGVNRGYNRGEPNNRVDYVNRNGTRGGYANRGDGYHRTEHIGGNGGRMNRAGFAADAAKNTAPRVSATA